MRDTQFAAMTGASGDEGEAGRRILAGAACYELRQHLTPGEHQRAIATFGDLPGHFASGIGDEVVADTAHGYVPPADGPPGPAPEPPEPPGRFDLLGWLLVGAVAACLAGAALLGILGTWTDPKQDSIDKQVEKIKHHAFVAEKKRTVADRTVTFHSGGASRLLVLRPRTGSDEIRVYDQVGDGKLTDRPFAFQPEAAATRPFRLPDDPVSGDMDGDGVQELVDAYVVHRGTHAIRIPVILAWDNNQARYQLVPVLSHAPRLPARVKGAVLHPRPFTVPFTLAHGIVHVGPAYGVTSLVVQPTEHRILVASEIGAVGLRKAILAISVFRLEPTGGAPDLRLLCSPRYRAGVVVEPVAANGASDYRAELARIARPLEAALFQERQNGKCVAR
jgi:hypothetical protein